MLRSPPASRTRGKKIENKEIAQPSLSKSSDKPTNINMVDSKAIEECVSQYLMKGHVFDALVKKLSHQIKVVVEEALKDSLVKLNEEVTRLRGEVAILVDQVAVLDEMVGHRTDDLEQYQRRNNLRVFGIAEKEGEDTDRLVLNLVKDKMGVDLPLEAIERSHRVGVKQRPRKDSTQQHRPIIVRFCSYRDRRRVFQEKKKLKGTHVTIREDLTAVRLGVLQAAVTRYGVRNTWTADGKVFWAAGADRGSATRLSDLPTSKAAENK